MNKRTILIILVAVLQLVVVVSMAMHREWIVQHGETLHVRTMPVDPRDIFRGDYVRLDYEISHLPKSLWAEDIKKHPRINADYGNERDLRVYTVLEAAPGSNLAKAVQVSSERPETGTFIRGRIERCRGDVMHVNYSIGALFVEQGKALKSENKMRQDAGMRVPMEIEIGLGKDGIAVIKGYRWSPLGIGLEIERDENNRPASARLTLLNCSSSPLGIIDLPEGQSFKLSRDFRNMYRENKWQWVGREERMEVSEKHIVVLKPDESHETDINFDDPSWYITKGDKVNSLNKPRPDSRRQRFRFIYDPPPPAEIDDVPNSDILWHGELRTTTFRGARVD